jgi:16S rRNA C967 or C1407 C5-methylase (RsmB/RsmF family)
MGKRWSRKNKDRKTGRDGDQRRKKPIDPSKYGQERDPYALIEGGNYKMEAFYAYQGLHDDYFDEASGTFKKCETNDQKEAERQKWRTSLKSMLPASFRIGNDVDSDLRERLEKDLEEYVGQKMEIVIPPKGGDQMIEKLGLKPEIKVVAPAKKISFIPHAYQLSIDRKTLRNNASLNTFHEWLKVQTAAGFVTRQETVSMIPPVVLAPKPTDIVLDMCAAPGSKTSQLLEIISLPVNPHDTEPTGCVVANDSDVKRAYMLVHQMRRINSPAIFITSCDAQFFPLLRDETYPTEGIFDRVLADVPCGGDGTTRKNPGVWKKWSQLSSYGLHTLQLGIALKGARLTKVGGHMVYSTCSQNPIENEAVVAELLRASEGSLELVDPRADLPGLLARPGWSTWKILSEDRSRKQMKDYQKKNNDKMKMKRKEFEDKNKDEESGEAANTTQEDATKEEEPCSEDPEEAKKKQENDDFEAKEKYSVMTPFEPTSLDATDLKAHIDRTGLLEFQTFQDVPGHLQRRVRQTCFPPTEEEAAQLHLEKCLRVLPQDMDTGGFFVALLKKVAPMNTRARGRFEALEKEVNSGGAEDDEEDEDGEPKVKKVKIDREDAVDASTGDDAQMDDSPENDTSASGKATGDEAAVAASTGTKKNLMTDKDGKRADVGKDDFIPIPDDIIEPLIDYYGLSSESFKREKYMQRACSDAKVLYFLGSAVRGLIDKGIQERVTVVSSGLKGFVRNGTGNECEAKYRIAQEGVHFVAPHMTKRKLVANLEDFKKCLDPKNILLSVFSPEFAEQARALAVGSFVVQLKGHEDDYIRKLVLSMWRCRGDNVNCLVTQAEIDGMKSKLRSGVHKDEPAEEAMVEGAEEKSKEE